MKAKRRAAKPLERPRDNNSSINDTEQLSPVFRSIIFVFLPSLRVRGHTSTQGDAPHVQRREDNIRATEMVPTG
eukprot:2473918-Amphidinium_carterae.1